MKLDDVIIIDAETTGPDIFEHDIMSLYMCSATNDQSLELFIKHDHEVKWGAIGKRYFNRYQDEWQSKAINSELAVEKINAFIDKQSKESVVLSGHNVAFDYYFLKKLARTSGIKLSKALSHRLVDTHSLIALRVMEGSLPKYTLKPDGAAEYFGIETLHRHSAKYDALLSKNILLNLFDQTIESAVALK